MIHLFTNADGNQTEGIGAIAQCQIHTYTLSKLFGINYASTKFKNLQHYQEYDTQENFCNDVTNFFNFPNQINPLNPKQKRRNPVWKIDKESLTLATELFLHR